MKKIMTKVSTLSIITLLSSILCASPEHSKSGYFFSTGIGYATYDGFENKSADAGLLRMYVGKNIFQFEKLLVAAELGVQTGSHGRAGVPESVKGDLGGTAVQLTLNPSVNTDLRFFIPSDHANLGPYFKLGISYWRLFTDRDTVTDRSIVTGTLEGGISLPVNSNSDIELGYQESFASKFRIYTKTTATDVEGSGTIFGAPKQRNIIISLVSPF